MFTMFMTSILCVGLFFVLSNHHNKLLDLSFGSLTHTGILKGVATLLVVINHIGAKSGYRVFQPLGGIGVSLFLMCSGYGLIKSFQEKGFTHYFEKRIIKVIIPYWIVFLLYTTLTQPSLELITVLKGMLLVKVNGIFWFIQYLCLFYTLFYFAYKFFRGKASLVFLLIASILVITANQTLLLGEQSFAFLLGVQLAHSRCRFDQSKLLFLSTFYLSIGLLSLVVKQIDWIRESNYLLLNLNGFLIKTGSALGILYLVFLTINIKFWRIFLLPGKFSLEIYLVHVTLTNLILKEFAGTSILILIGSSLLGIALLCGCLFLLNRVILKVISLFGSILFPHQEKECSSQILDD